MTDPRIHERRVQVARETGRRRRRVLAVVLALALLLAAGMALVHSSVFGARHVEVSGEAHARYATVVKVAGLQGAPPLVDLSAAVIARRVESLPWVKTAKVNLAFPATVRIAVTPRTPVAAVAAASGFALVDPTGRVLEDVTARPPGLPLVDPGGPVPAPGKRLARPGPELARVAAGMPESMVADVAAIGTGRQGIVLELALSHKVVALFGNASLLADKYVALDTLLVRADLAGIATIDLRVPSAPALLP